MGIKNGIKRTCMLSAGQLALVSKPIRCATKDVLSWNVLSAESITAHNFVFIICLGIATVTIIHKNNFYKLIKNNNIIATF